MRPGFLKTSLLCSILLFLLPPLRAAVLGGDIKVDHFGYGPGDAKIAYFTVDPGPSVEVQDAGTGATVFTATHIVDKGMDATSPLIYGDHVWWADFSSFTSPGRYYVYSPSLGEKSYDFNISGSAYQGPVTAALKSLYYARCGIARVPPFSGPWTDPAPCHAGDAALTAICNDGPDYGPITYGTLDLSGGWHDAGDYEKKLGNARSCGTSEAGDGGETLWYLLTAYELNPGFFASVSSNIPESGNGAPDILNEAKWELDFYLRMQRPDGHVLSMVRTTNLGTLTSPPSSDVTPRFYMPPCYRSEAIFTADTARAARLFASVPAYAAYAVTLRNAALKTWNDWVGKSPDSDPTDPAWVEPYKDIKIWAASEILRMDPSQTAVRTLIDNSENWTGLALSNNQKLNFAVYNYLQTPGATASVTAAMAADLGRFADSLFALNDVYDSGMASWNYTWNSNWYKAECGMALWWAARLGATGSHTAAQCRAHAEDYLHYLDGVNPLNMLYMTNTASLGAGHCVWQLFNTWFGSYNNAACKAAYIGKPSTVTDPLYPYFPGTDNFGINDGNSSTDGPPPGYVPDGPNFSYQSSGGMAQPPNLPGGAAAPYAKSYRDWNWSDSTGTQSMPWMVNESGIYDTSSYLMLASLFLPPSGPTPTPTASPTGTRPTATDTATPTPSFTPTATPTVTATPSPTPTFLPGPYCPVTLIDDFEDASRNGAPPARTQLWSGTWSTVSSTASIGVAYGAPGADGTASSAGITASVLSGGWAEWLTPLYASGAAFNAASYGIQGVRFWVKGGPQPCRFEVESAAVTDYDYYGENFTPSPAWTLLQVPFDSMTRQAWGTQAGLPAHPTAADLTGIVFVTQGAPATYALAVDQVAFYCAAAPPTATPSAPPPRAMGPPVLYPNPLSGGSLNIRTALDSASDVRVKVFTTAFRKVLDRDFPSVPPDRDLSLAASDGTGEPLADGLYYVVVSTDRGRFTSKLLVLR